MEGYLVIVCGHEGIEQIVGLFDKDGAIQRIQEVRKLCRDGDEVPNLTEDQDDYEDFDFVGPEQVCVMKVDAMGAECVCKELGVSTDKPTWLY